MNRYIPYGIHALLFFFLASLLVPAQAAGTVMTSDTTWSGEVAVEQDVLVPEGVTLTILPGTKVRVAASESTKTDPEFLSPLTEITVRGTLSVDGHKGAEVAFLLNGEKGASWAGIIVDGGKVVLRSTRISDADTGLLAVKGSLSVTDSLLTGNRYGLIIQGPDAAVRVRKSRIQDNEYGVLLLNGAKLDSASTDVRSNRKKDRYTATPKGYHLAGKEYTVRTEQAAKSRIYGDEALIGTTVWRGRVQVNGIIRVPENSRLILVPGTIVEFSRKDTNNDGIGENGILIQGVVIAKGTPEAPIIFRSGEGRRSMGDWDSINIMNSDKSQNLIEYCQIEDAYRGLHFHFSNVAVRAAVLRNNYRGIQFQESVVDISGSHFYGNKSAFQARDSDIVFTGNTVHHNYTGMNVFRNSIVLKDSVIADNYQEGVRVREGVPLVERNLIDGNRHGLMVHDARYGAFTSNVVSHNLESGISLRNTENIELSGNAVQGNGLNGMNLQEASAVIRGNLISDNGERGIGVQSFQGTITDNTITGNGLYNLGIDGAADVSAVMNWWGRGDVRKTLYDRENDPSKGRAVYLPLRERPVLFAWPLKTMQTDAVWRGGIAVTDTLSVDPGAVLTISPMTRVLFSKGMGLAVKGKILARGEKSAPITFAAAQARGAGGWDELLIDHAAGSEFTHCIFEDATWAVHSHFTDLKVEGCVFTNNTGGIRFTSGPLSVTRSLFEKNDVGIRAFRGNALISGNIISGNRLGIFVREKGGGLTIQRNNLFGNSDFDIRLGDFNDEDVDARNNWWGDRAPADKIYDARSEPGVGTVHYEPSAKKPFALGSPVIIPDGTGAHREQ